MTIGEKEQILYEFSTLPFMNAGLLRMLVKRTKSLRALYCMEEGVAEKLGDMDAEKLKALASLPKNHRQLQQRRLREEERGIRFLSFYHASFPERLRQIPYAPLWIYAMGKIPDSTAPTVALIGARNCSTYGKHVAEDFGRELALAGVSVVSGMARGIDGIGQRAALSAGGASYGVLGCGVDVIYPKQNADLYYGLLRNGGVISEYPPQTKPERAHFPSRNRIISGLADVLLVVEAGEKSGTMITTDFALEQGKEIGVVPGRIGDPFYAGCNQLIREGATLVNGMEDVFELLKSGEVANGLRRG